MNLAAFVNSTVHTVQTNQLTLKAVINRVLKRIRINGMRKNVAFGNNCFFNGIIVISEIGEKRSSNWFLNSTNIHMLHLLKCTICRSSGSFDSLLTVFKSKLDI